MVANPAESSDSRPPPIERDPILPQQVREQLAADGNAHPVDDDQEDRALCGERCDDLIQKPLDRNQPVQCRIRFGPGAEKLREFSRSRLSHFRHPPEELRIGLGKFTDRVARAERESGPIDEPTLGKVVIRRLDERTRDIVCSLFLFTEPADQANRHVHTFEPPPFSRGQLMVADLAPRRRELLEGARRLRIENARQVLAEALEPLTKAQRRSRAQVCEPFGTHGLQDLVGSLKSGSLSIAGP